jgi:outer membrane immunogenic protein
VTPTVFSTTSSNNVGYALGGGLEYAFTNNLTAKLEGLYVNFDRGSRNAYANAVVGVTNTGAPVTAASTYGASSQRDDFGVVRLGLNYKFSAF